MGVEIERKFLLSSSEWRKEVTSQTRMKQGYLSRGSQSSVRVRIAGESAKISVKSTKDGISRLEYEYDIPMQDAEELLEKVAHRPLIEKIRYIIPKGKHRWEVDEFFGENQGLLMAEIELDDAGEDFEHPPWLGAEVSDDVRYYNSSLSESPYSEWKTRA